jgi:nicotinamide-nucleotide amidase
VKIEIISIGNEVLRGQTVNSNSYFLSAELVKLGLRVYRHQVIQDDPQAIQKAIEESILSNHITIFTGGLGPTIDDITKESISKVFNTPLVFNDFVANELIQRFGHDLASLKNQATVPQNATLLKNEIGTAPGFLFIKNDHIVAFMPGVPLEMKQMFSKELLPYIIKKKDQEHPLYRKEIHFSNLLEIYVDPLIREMKQEYPLIDFGIYPSYGLVGISMESKDKALLDEPYERLKKTYLSNFYESKSGKLEEAIKDKFDSLNKTLGLAESCTGGAIGAKLVEVAGASSYFKGSIVSYSNEIKERILNVKNETLAKHGAVSQETVVEMAHAALDIFESDVAVSVSGIAGPEGGSNEKPVGTIWACIAFKKGPTFSWQFTIKGNRQMIIEGAIHEILGVLNSKL